MKVRTMIENGDADGMKVVKAMVDRGGGLLCSLAVGLCEVRRGESATNTTAFCEELVSNVTVTFLSQLAVKLRPSDMAVIFRVYKTCLRTGLGGTVLASSFRMYDYDLAYGDWEAREGEVRVCEKRKRRVGVKSEATKRCESHLTPF